jgi:hypothetical protein
LYVACVLLGTLCGQGMDWYNISTESFEFVCNELSLISGDYLVSVEKLFSVTLLMEATNILLSNKNRESIRDARLGKLNAL